MKAHTIRYLLKEGFRGLWRNRMMAVASSGTIILSLLVLGVSYSIAQNFDYIMNQIEVEMGITAYVSDYLSLPEIEALETAIRQMPNVVAVEYITKEEALKIFAGENTDLYDKFVKDNPLPGSLEIKVSEAVHQQLIVENLMRVHGLEVSYFEAETEMFIQLNRSIQLFSAALIIILTIVALFLITNTIKLTVYIRRKEIEIMKFIGATDAFIRIPFMIEGVTIGIIGAIIPSFIIVYVYEFVEAQIAEVLSSMIGGIALKSIDSIMIGLLPMYVILAVGVAALGSVIAIREHLKV